MRVLLINPPYGMLPTGKGIPSPPGSCPPLGLPYMAAVLEENKIPVKILDADVLNLELKDIISYIDREKPDLVGLTAVTVTFDSSLRIINEIKKRYPRVITILGGVHATICWREILENSSAIDYCIIGEGEYVLLELIKSLDTTKKLNCLRGLAFKKSGKIIFTGHSDRITDLDALPFPARHLLPMDRYVAGFLVKINGRPFTAFMTSRGCPYSCKYCASSAVWKHHVVFNSAQRVVDEITDVTEKFKLRYFNFWDDTFTADKKRVLDICKSLVERRLNLEWACQVRANTIDEETLVAMHKAGCGGLYIGIEFGNQRILDSTNKQLKLSTVRDAIRLINRVGGFKTQGLFMLGYPGENKRTMTDTINLAKSLDLTSAVFSITVPYPGTNLYDFCAENNLFLTQEWSKYSPKRGNVFIKLDDVSADETAEFLVKAYREFYLRPAFVIKALRNVRTAADIKYYFSQLLRTVGISKGID